MNPELFELPFFDVTVKSYGVMMVVGFLMAVLVVRIMARRVSQDPDHFTNVALYALIAGVVGSRAFYVIHNWSQFRVSPMEVFAVWNGGLELIGGVVLSVLVILIYLWVNRLPVRVYMDILTVGLMLGVCFGRIGCFLNGCCFGMPTDELCSVRFPYGSFSYQSQVNPDYGRERGEPYFELPADYFGFPVENSDQWVSADEETKDQAYLKPFDKLSAEQQFEVTKGKYSAKPVHPTQLYSSANAFILFLMLLFFWYNVGRYRPGSTFGLMFVLYGPTRFLIEFLRDDNPFEDSWWTITDQFTISQNISIYLTAVGLLVLAFFLSRKPVSYTAEVIEEGTSNGNKRKDASENTEVKGKETADVEAESGAKSDKPEVKVVKKRGRPRKTPSK